VTGRPPGSEFIKESKAGNLRLRLYRQSNNATVPVFGIRGPVEGTLEVSKPKGLIFIAVRVGVLIICRARHWNLNLNFKIYLKKLKRSRACSR
jgi:hypothetical protein